jgi:hypothetical protein
VFATRYRARECNKVNNCRKCRGSHHQSICATDHPKHENKQNPADQNVEDAAAKSETSLNKPEQVITTTANTGSGVQPKSYYRQQLSIYALNTENSSSAKVMVLFDSGSQRSYVTSSLKSRLGLSTWKRETVHLTHLVKTF